MITGRQLRDARELLGISRHELATRTGVSRLSVRLWESYGDELPSALAPLARTTSYLHSAGIIEFRPDGSVAILDKAVRTMKAQIAIRCGNELLPSKIDVVGKLDFTGDSVDEFAHRAVAPAALARLPERGGDLREPRRCFQRALAKGAAGLLPSPALGECRHRSPARRLETWCAAAPER